MNLSINCYIFVLIVLISSIIVHGTVKVEQVHLSLGTNETEMLVTWTIPEERELRNCFVHYGLSKDKMNMYRAAEAEFMDKDGAKYWTYRALMIFLKPSTTYYYWIQMGEPKEEENKIIFQFRTLPTGHSWLPNFAIYGDLGFTNEKSLPYLKKDVEQDMYDVIFHVGDIAYDLQDENGWIGHDFMRTIEPIASKVPYMVCPGNHEQFNNFSHYDTRFSMLGDRYNPKHDAPLLDRINNHFHSMDIGPVHVVMFSTEYYYFTKYGWQQIETQYKWLEEDLKRANENRKERPWIIAMGHRPLYCVTLGDRSCIYETLERPDIRQGIKMNGEGERKYGLEDLFHKYGVDLQFYGHEHFYARMLPMYNYTLMSENLTNPYDNPKASIHITTGSAGNWEIHGPFNPDLKNITANHFYDFGYTRLFFKDLYHIKLQQISDDKDGIVLDEVDILKKNPFPRWMNQKL